MNLETLTLPLEVADKKFNLGIGAAIAGVTALLAAMGAAVNATFQWADELDGLGDVMGVTNKQAAALAYTARVSGVSVDALSKANVILAKGLVNSKGKLDTVGKALKTWGINALDVNGKVKDQAALIDEIGKKYSELGTQTERVNFLTEVYGRSGAELIDFFDTLAQQGGIDAVTKKVEDLGLAIDPNRYEQFNRNLEELKLIGLSLAVGFTEKVMPVLEDVIGWFSKIADDPNVQKAKDLISDFFSPVTEQVAGGKVIVGKSPFEAMLSNLQQGIDNFTWDGLIEGAETWAENIDWQNVADDISTGIDSVDWFTVGDTIGDKVMMALNAAWETRGGENIQMLGQTMADGASEVDWMSVFDSASNAILGAIEGLSGMSQGELRNMFTGWVTTAQAELPKLQIETSLSLANIHTSVKQNLQQISQSFHDIAGGWIVNATAALNLRIKGFYGLLETIVANINRILGKITSINIQLPDLGGGTGGASGSTGALGGGGSTHRASGGPVIGGQGYTVFDSTSDEIFTPARNGRIDPIQSQTVTVDFDYRTFASFLATELAKNG